MTTTQLIIICVTSVAIAALLRGGRAPAAADRDELVGLDVVVNTRRPDEMSARGVVVRANDDWLILRDATFLHASGGEPADGFVRIPRSAISTVQQITVTSDVGRA